MIVRIRTRLWIEWGEGSNYKLGANDGGIGDEGECGMRGVESLVSEIKI